MAELGSSALFGARFRENASRSLLIPRAYPGKRTPLWQQRLKSQNLLEVAKRYAQFPVILETYRECLQDVLDLPGPDRPADEAAPSRAVARRGRHADRLAVRVLAAVRLRRDVHVRGRHAERGAPRGRPVAGSRSPARAARPGRAARAHRPGRAADRRRRPPAPLASACAPRRATSSPTCCAASATSPSAEVAERIHEPASAQAWLSGLADERRAVRLRIGGEERWVAADDAGLYRDALGAVPPGGLPEAFLADVPDALRLVAARYARTHVPFTTEELRDRYRVDMSAVLSALEVEGDLVRGELRPGGSGEREWCDPDVLRRLRRASLASLRKEIEPADQRRARGVRAVVAGRRPPRRGGRRPRSPARGPRPPPGAGTARRRVGARRPPAPHGRVLADVARRAVRVRRGGLGRRRRPRAQLGQGRPVLPRGRRGDRTVQAARSTLPASPRTTCCASASAARPASSPTCWPRSTSRPRTSRRRSGTSSGPARSPTTRGRHCAPRA